MADFPQEFATPKMLALRDDRQRRFCWLMACGQVSATEAAKQAGYSDHADGARVRAHEMMQRPYVLDAIDEASGNVLRGLAPMAIAAARAILQNPKHPAHSRIIEAVLDRTGFFAKTEHKVTVEHVDHSAMAAIAARLALELGVDRMKLVGGNVIDGKQQEIRASVGQQRENVADGAQDGNGVAGGAEPGGNGDGDNDIGGDTAAAVGELRGAGEGEI